MMFVSSFVVAQNVEIRRERILPLPGKLFVMSGQQVAPDDVIAEGNANTDLFILNTAEGLGVPKNKAGGYIQCEVGDRLRKGDLIAGTSGISRRVMRAPVDGQVVYIRNERVLLVSDDEPIKIIAGFPGKVVGIIPTRGAVIESSGGLVQGVWGNGRIDSAPLEVCAGNPAEQFSSKMIDNKMRGKVVLSGICSDFDAFKKAEEFQLCGLIFASLHTDLISLALEAQFPVLLLEGFGRRSLNSAAFELLCQNAGQLVTINAEIRDRYLGTRPEVFISKPSNEPFSIMNQGESILKGKTVRVVTTPYAGMLGVILEEIRNIELPNGLWADAVKVQLENGLRDVIPIVNLELVKS